VTHAEAHQMVAAMVIEAGGCIVIQRHTLENLDTGLPVIETVVDAATGDVVVQTVAKRPKEKL
jgi:hypothetical protein